ncbi:MAG: DNA polymerase III subunit gamma/tau [Prevotella sp.]|nr:DNA polymerase III subunit gamma/tau [Prevotella sp.]
MQEYIVSARKYRPMTFDSVVGQSALTTTLKNAVKGGKLAHAYLFCGPRGVGKTTCARIFAKAINCLSPTEEGEACNHCESCQAFNEQRSYNIFELDAASNNSVENIKSLMEQTRIPPQVGKYKVFIIDEVHMLSTQAFNAFLKTLEEPPQHVIFILATTEKHKILPTIISRCQIYDFERMTVANTINHLKHVAEQEGVQYEDEALAVIAEKADGGMRDALSIFDQAVSFCQGNITYQKVIEDLNVLDSDYYFRIIDLSLENKVSEIMVLLNQIISRGFDGGHLINGLAAHVRNVLMAKDSQTLPLLEVSQQQVQRYQQQAQKAPTQFLYRALSIMNQCDQGYRQSSNKRLLVELTLIRVAQITQPEDADVPSAGRSPKRLKSLFRKLLNNVQQPKASQQGAAAGRKKATTATKAEPVVVAEEKPMPKPAPKPVAAMPTGAKLKLDQLGVTFARLRQNEQETANKEETEEIVSEEQHLFTKEQLQEVWIGMCNRMPVSMKAMSQRMKNIEPHILNTPKNEDEEILIEIVADNQILLNELNGIKGRIRATLTKELRNGHIQINIRQAEAEEIKPILTKRQIFDEVRRDNPAIEKLRTLLDLQLT